MVNEWDEILYENMKLSSYSYKDIDFKFHIASSPEEMAAQIDEAAKRRPEVIIVNPYVDPSLQDAIRKVYDSGAYVIFVGQTADMNCYHSFVGENSSGIGKMLAKEIIDRLPDGGNVVALESGFDAPFYKHRKEACLRLLSSRDDIHIVASFDAGGSEYRAHSGMDSLKLALADTKIDLVFSYAFDEVIIGAYKSGTYPDAVFVGSDAFNGDSIHLVADGSLAFTIYSATGGSEAVNIAASMVHGMPYDRFNYSISIPVSRDNANVLLDRDHRIQEYKRKVVALNTALEDDSVSGKWKCIFLASSLLFLLIIIILAALLKRNGNVCSKLEGEIAAKNDHIRSISLKHELAEASKTKLETERDYLLCIVNKSLAASESVDSREDESFIRKFRNEVEREIDNPDLSIENLAFRLFVSRTQLFRRVKAESGMTPNELIQSIRLQIADSMLRTGNRTVSEVAYSTGFNSPSYFAKCFKDKYGISPGEIVVKDKNSINCSENNITETNLV